MKISSLTEIKSISGEVLKDKDGQPITFRKVVTEVLMTPQDPAKKQRGEEKYKLFKIAMKIQENDEVDLDIDELKLIKDTVGELSPPLVVGKIYDILEAKGDGDAPKKK